MMQNKKIIAVTGGIGSGKSTVCEILREWGYKVFSCDEVYTQLLLDKNFIKKIESRFGNVTDGNGNLDRKKLSEKVFSDTAARKDLEKITHPQIMASLLAQAKEEEDRLVFCEVPLLFENGFEKLFDDVIVVMREIESRVEAVKKRSGLSEEEINARISSQYDYSKTNTNQYKIIYNNGNIDNLQCTMRDIISEF